MGTNKRETVEITCDREGCSTKIIWVQQEVQANPNALPDSAWRLLTFATFDGQVKGFCSKYCLLTHLKTFEPLKSPREQAEQAEIEKQAVNDKFAEQLQADPSLATTLPNPTERGKVIQFPDLRDNLGVGAPLPDATGDSTELDDGPEVYD